MVGFDAGTETRKFLDGNLVESINSDLTGRIDLAGATILPENRRLSFMGLTPTGRFQLDTALSNLLLSSENSNSQLRNADVLKPYINGKDITERDRLNWIVDFSGMSLAEAMQYHLPMRHVLDSVKPYRDTHSTLKLRENWWLFEAARTGMTSALDGLSRQLMTSLSAKHRFFVWYPTDARAANTVVAIARDDDYMFGVLHSNIHLIWVLRKCGWLGVGNDSRYTATSTFQTFPFPWSPGHEDTDHPAHAAISAAAAQLHEERDAWLNPHQHLAPSRQDSPSLLVGEGAGGWGAKQLKDRTLTNLYNALQVFRGQDSMKTKAAAADFAPRLDELHLALDHAVCDAYGWEYDILNDEEEILRRLLALNLERAVAQ